MSIQLQEQLYDKIREFLSECSKENTPTVCNLISTPKGKEAVVKLIAKKIIVGSTTIGQAIIDIETEFNPNSYTE